MGQSRFLPAVLVLCFWIELGSSGMAWSAKIPKVIDSLLAVNPIPVSISPNGLWMLQKKLYPDTFEIGLVEIASKQYKFLAKSSDSQLSLTWSPDSKIIAFQRSKGGNRRYTIHLLNVETGTERELSVSSSDTAAPRLRWSPNGKQLAFITGSFGKGYKLVVANIFRSPAEFKVVMERVNPEVDFDWSPNGLALALVSRSMPNDISIAFVDGTAQKNIFIDRGVKIKHLDWADDGRNILFTARRVHDDYFNLFLLELSNSKSKLVESQMGDIFRPYYISELNSYLFHLNQEGKILILIKGGREFKELLPLKGSLEFRRLFRKSDENYIMTSSENESIGILGWNLRTQQIKNIFKPTLKFEWEYAQLKLPTKGQLIPCLHWRARNSTKERRLIVKIHGGPQLQEMPNWTLGSELLLHKGIDMLVVNFPGSTGYGVKYERMQNLALQQEVIQGVIEHVISHWKVPRGNIGLWGSSYGSILALNAKACSREKLGPIFLEAPSKLALPSCVRVGVQPGMGIYVFRGAHDPGVSADQLRKTLTDIFGPSTFKSPNGGFTVFADEGHHFHKISSIAGIYDDILSAFGLPRGH